MYGLRVPAVVSGVLLSSLALLVSLAPALASPNGVVISELRARGPAGGNDEFVEIFNTSAGDVDVSGYRLQGCAAASGNPSDRTTVPAGTVLDPGDHYLFTNSGSGGYSGAVPGDRTYSTGFTDFQANNASGARLVDASGAVVDGVGSPNSPCREGAGITTPATTGDNSFERRDGGRQDTEDNAADFVGPKAGGPQNLSGAGAPGPEITKIHDVQGPGAESPITGRTVTVEGVVTGIDDEIGASFGSGNSIRRFPEDAGIFVQEEPADADQNSETSEGVFVGFVRDRAAYTLGDVVRVNGRVNEKFGHTIISETINREPEKVGTTPVPDPVEIDAARAEGQDPQARPYYESLEGMRVRLAVGTANSGGTNKFGELFVTPGTEQDRVFRTETEPALIATDADAGAGDPDNPFRDPDGSTTEVEADLFDTVSGATGPLLFAFENYRIMVQEDGLPTVTDTGVTYPYEELSPSGPKQFRVASFNVENYFPVGGALDGGNVSQEEFDEKTARLTDATNGRLKRPEVVAVQEVYDLATLRALAASLGGYTAYLEEGNDSRGIDVGFLVKDGVKVEGVTQYGKTATAPDGLDCSDVPGGLFDRPPLAIEVQAKGFGGFTVFSNHFASKAAPDACREAQAAFVRDRVAELEDAGRRSIVAGDLNAFEDESALRTLEDGETSLDNLWDAAPEQERYSFAFQGKLQTLDHVLVTSGLKNRIGDFRYAHFDNDYFERDDQAEPDGHHVSDHDPPVLTLSK
ncbi:lamin tail domain-containing protein [Rubrobacter tropicus]|uniref:lamin tail domain-containing protein n=1 Tax=Rubrobacter tropicus TaxID=2653851 RepID=UPI00140D1B2E|nr:lamin tail domain-containing protein [Rubrobacter tropicus]